MIFPQIIQGGMGVAVSDWRLARSVAVEGQIGVVSGTALDVVLARRLQSGDPDGKMRHALSAFPAQDVSHRISERYFVAGGKPPGQRFSRKPMVGLKPGQSVQELLIAANFVEVFLAKERHDGLVGINYLNKIQSPLLPSLYGAMLAHVDIVIVGAGIPLEIPAIIDSLSRSEPVELKLHIKERHSGWARKFSFNPMKVIKEVGPSLPRPLFFPIVASSALATVMVKKCKGQVDGLIIEGPSAGGHNAPPRGHMQLSRTGEPIYGPRDDVDIATIKSLGLPFWLAGSYGHPAQLAHARAVGATGIQVGTLFAFCEESGLRENLKREAIGICQHDESRVFTDPVASPTGFPFKVFSISNTNSEPELYSERHRQCDLGYLREAYERPDGTLGWRCPAENPKTYVRKGGKLEDTVGRKCLCNGLMANIGLPQVCRDGQVELPLLTCGDDLSGIPQVVRSGETSYSSSSAINYLLDISLTP